MVEYKYERLAPEQLHRAAENVAELFSVNTFNTAAKAAGLGYFARKKIYTQLRLVIHADTLCVRVEQLIKITAMLNAFLHVEGVDNTAVNDLFNQCEAMLYAIFNARDKDHLETLIKHRAARLPFKPDFITDAPAKAPCRKLLDDLVKWQQTTDPLRAHCKLTEIANESGRNFNQVWGKTALGKQTKHYQNKKRLKSKIPFERRLFLWLSIGPNLNHLLVKGTTRLIDNLKQEADYNTRPLIFTDKQLENYRILAYNGIFIQLELKGRADNARLVAAPFTTHGMSSHHYQKDDALLVVTPDGGMFAGSSVAEDVIHPSFAKGRETFFCGRIHVNKQGVLRYLDNYTGHYLDRELNMYMISKHFYDIGVIGMHNRDMIGLLTAMYHLPQGDEFINYCRKMQFPERLLWDTNRKLFLKLATTRHLTEADQNAALAIIVEEARNNEDWNSEWEQGPDGKDLSLNHNYTYERVRDRLCSSPVNFPRFVNFKHGKDLYVAAPEDPKSGIYNDHDVQETTLDQNRAELKDLRTLIMQKCHLAELETGIAFCEARPAAHELNPGTIYLYPMQKGGNNTQCYVLIPGFPQYVLDYDMITNRLTYANLANVINDRRNIVDVTPEDMTRIRTAATALKDYESYLIFTTEQLSNLYRAGVDPSKVIENNVSPEVYRAFLDEQGRFLEVETNNRANLQVENLFYGKMCLWATNKGKPENPIFKPDQQRYRATVPFQESQVLTEHTYNGL